MLKLLLVTLGTWSGISVFLVDGKTRPTLAGHFALDRIYPSTDTTLQPAKTDTQ